MAMHEVTCACSFAHKCMAYYCTHIDKTMGKTFLKHDVMHVHLYTLSKFFCENFMYVVLRFSRCDSETMNRSKR